MRWIDEVPGRFAWASHPTPVEGVLPGAGGDPCGRGRDRPGAQGKQAGESKVIQFNLCGHGHFDMQAYADYFAGKLTDQSYEEADLQSALAHLPPVAAE